MPTAATQDFSAMIKHYMPISLLREEIIKRDWLLQNCKLVDGFMGGLLDVPFEGAAASTIQYGNYAGAANIASSQYVKGQISGYREIWGSLIFNDSDLTRHGSLEKSFLSILPKEIEKFMRRLKETSSRGLLVGPHLATPTANGAVGGTIAVDKPQYFEVGQEIVLKDSDTTINTAGTAAYVRTVNMNTKVITVYDARTGGAVVDLSGIEVAKSPKIYPIGGDVSTLTFTSLRESLLTAALGGTDTLYGETKTDYPYLQPQLNDGTLVTATNILEKLFDFWVTVSDIGKGNPTKIVMSSTNFASCMKVLEVSRQYTGQDRKMTKFGWNEIDIMGPRGSLSLVMVNEMDDDVIMVLDMDSFEFHHNGMFNRRRDPDGKEYFTIRGEASSQGTGYQYVLDTRFFGQFILTAPSYNGIMHTISY